MSEYVIKSHCHINTNRESDTFVGLDCRNEELTVNFPLGYQLSDNDSGIRKDILLLMRTLALASSAQNNTVNFSDEKRNIHLSHCKNIYLLFQTSSVVAIIRKEKAIIPFHLAEKSTGKGQSKPNLLTFKETILST